MASHPAEAAVQTFTEWDPLEEVIVGRLSGAVVPTWQEAMRPTLPEAAIPHVRDHGGELWDTAHVARAEQELEGLVAVLEDLGIAVQRPDELDHSRSFATPDWSVAGGLYAGMPRDCILTIGDLIIEAPMSWRCRQHEADAYRGLFGAYFRAGARWIAVPRPLLRDALYLDGEDGWAVNELEPVFDAADFMKFGLDIVAQRSHVTNHAGIEWVQRTLGEGYRVHTVPVNDPHAMHIDATLIPLAPGKLLVNPERYLDSPLFKDWDVRPAPPGTTPSDWPMHFCSSWVSMNLLSLDESTVVVEEQELPLIRMLESWGFSCVAIPFRHVYSLGGSFHCVTMDVRRRGAARSYLCRPH